MRLSRRKFIQQAGLASAGIMAAPTLFAACSPKKGQQIPAIGLQLYTLRELLDKDAKGTLKNVSAIGYGTVETYGYSSLDGKGTFWGLKPAELKATLDDLNLKTFSGHYGLDDFLTEGNGKIDAVKPLLEVAKSLGQQYLVVPMVPGAILNKLNLKDYQFIAAQLNKAGELAKEIGLGIAYHNHFFEFRKLEDGRTGYDVLLEETEASLVNLEIDIFWAQKAGADIPALFSKHPGRFPMWHVKDIDKTHPEIVTGPALDSLPVDSIFNRIKFTEVGTGTIDFKALFALKEKAGLKQFYVEQDQIYVPDKFESIKNSFDYIKGNLL
ncbi:Sugar phosphate isomerase/epimerase [bacterium A37T11]|nr:Sugar phosphate isomerase/epimerase [bacterium A37T11]